MNIKELAQHIGQQGLYRVNGLGIAVVIRDVKSAYGRIDYQIEPVAGCNAIWVNSSSVTIQKAIPNS